MRSLTRGPIVHKRLDSFNFSVSSLHYEHDSRLLVIANRDQNFFQYFRLEDPSTLVYCDKFSL